MPYQARHSAVQTFRYARSTNASGNTRTHADNRASCVRKIFLLIQDNFGLTGCGVSGISQLYISAHRRHFALAVRAFNHRHLERPALHHFECGAAALRAMQQAALIAHRPLELLTDIFRLRYVVIHCQQDASILPTGTCPTGSPLNMSRGGTVL